MDPEFGVDDDPSCPEVTEEELNSFKFSIDQIFSMVPKLEKQVREVEQFYRSINVHANNSKDKGREKHNTGSKKLLQGTSSTEATASEKTRELMHQFSTILHQITQHRWAWPFMQPVDVEGLGLHDYYEVIDKPMDFSTIKSKMDARDGSGYQNVREIYSDVKLIFQNAMKYNDEKNDIHLMAKTLLEKFEKKWLQLLPKVVKAESGPQNEEESAQLDAQLAQQANYENVARELSDTLCEVDMNLRNLKARVVEKCRKLSTKEKKVLSDAFNGLSPENVQRALEIVSDDNSNFQPNVGLEVVLDLDALSDYTVWKLNIFVKNALQTQGSFAKDNMEDRGNNTKKRRNL